MNTLRRVVLVTRALPHHSIGGMEAVAWDLAREFSRQSAAVTVLTAAIPGMPMHFEEAGVRIRALPDTSWERYGAHWWRSTLQAFEDSLLSECDVVLSVSAGGFGLLPLQPRLPKVPFVLQAHGTSIGEIISKWKSGSPRGIATSGRNVAWVAKDLAAYRKFDAIVAVGTRVAEDFQRWPINRIVESSRLRLIPNGVDTRIFRPDPIARSRLRQKFGWTDDLHVVISVGRLHKQKGVDLGLDAIAMLAKDTSKVRYLVVGSGPEDHELRAKAARMNLGRLVQFTGAIDRKMVAEYLNAADAMLFATRRVEGNPLNVLEALSVGLPVIVSGHLKRTVPSSEHVTFVNQYDAAQVAIALHSALSRKPLRSTLLPQGFSLSESAESYLALFDELIIQQHRA